MSGASKKGSPFEALALLRGALPPGPVREESEPTDERAHDLFPGKVVIARTRKGRGGKGVTTITGIAGDAATLESLAGEIAKALGCGASLEAGAIIVQGEQEARLKAFLEARGARRVIVGT